MKKIGEKSVSNSWLKYLEFDINFDKLQKKYYVCLRKEINQ